MIFTFDEVEGIHFVTYKMPERRMMLIGWADERRLAFEFCIEMMEELGIDPVTIKEVS
jgi:hypothetical protein